MTNRSKLIKELEAMDDETLADYLDGNIGDDISLTICRQCQRDHGGTCLMEFQGLDDCPRHIKDWLQEEAV